MSDKISERLPTLFLALASIGFLVAVWLGRPPASGTFPKAVQDGLALLLTALVFVLGFAREAQRRISATVLEMFRINHDVFLKAWSSRDQDLTSGELIELALRRANDVAEFSRLARRTRSKENRRLVALSARREDIWNEMNNLAALTGYRQEVVRHAEQLAENPSHVIPGFFRPDSPDHLQKLRREIGLMEKDFAAAKEKWRVLEEAGGAGTAHLVSGPARIRLATTTQALMQNAHRFVTGMALLYAAGVIYAGPSAKLLGSLELWVATLVMVVALTYVGLVRRDLANDLRFTADTVEQLPLVLLAHMEVGFLRIDDLSVQEALERTVTSWREQGWWRLRQVEVQAPGFTWTSSVRGRYELALALASGIHSERQRRERQGHLRLAEKHLQSVADDPLALLALARTKEELGDPESAALLVPEAAEMVERLPGREAGDRWDGTLSYADLVGGNWWLWPQGVGEVELRKLGRRGSFGGGAEPGESEEPA